MSQADESGADEVAEAGLDGDDVLLSEGKASEGEASEGETAEAQAKSEKPSRRRAGASRGAGAKKRADTSEEDAASSQAPGAGPEDKKPKPRVRAGRVRAARADRESTPAKGDARGGEGDGGATERGEQASSSKRESSQPVEQESTSRGRRRSGAPAPRSSSSGSSRRVVRAHARYVRTSARKARMVCGDLRGRSISEARAILAFTTRDVARDWSKLLESAVANAETNHELLEDDLIVREAYADEGPTIKRFRPRAMGRATPIRKRTSHLTITLAPRP